MAGVNFKQLDALWLRLLSRRLVVTGELAKDFNAAEITRFSNGNTIIMFFREGR